MDTTLVAPTGETRLNAQRAEIRKCPPERLLIASLDIGKDIHVPYITNGHGLPLLLPQKISTRLKGYRFFVGELRQLVDSGNYSLVLLGHEPTGSYHDNWRHAFIDEFRANIIADVEPLMRYRLLNPALVKKERERTRSHRHKTDTIDAYAQANLLALGVGNPASLAKGELYRLRLVLVSMNQLAYQMQYSTSQMQTTLDRLWPSAIGNNKRFSKMHPELPAPLRVVQTRVFQRKRLRVLIEHAPNPYHLRQLGVIGIQKLLRSHQVRCGVKTATLIHNIACQCLLPPEWLACELAKQLQDQFAIYRLLEKQLKEQEGKALDLLVGTPGQLLATYPGVSDLLVARYLACVQDWKRFATARHIWSYAGLDLVTEASGNYKRIGKISKRGSAYLRNSLYQMGHLASFHAPSCIKLYEKAIKNGKSKNVAKLHVANKINRTFFRMLQTQSPYQEQMKPDEAAKWLAIGKARLKRQKKKS